MPELLLGDDRPEDGCGNQSDEAILAEAGDDLGHISDDIGRYERNRGSEQELQHDCERQERDGELGHFLEETNYHIEVVHITRVLGVGVY